MSRFLVFILAIIAFLIQEIPCSGFQALVVGVRDGNTIRVVYAGHSELITLYGIHVLGKDQVFGRKASEFVSSLLLGEEVEITPVEKRGYGCVYAMVSIKGSNLNRKMVAFGLGWVDAIHCSRPECREWASLGDKVRESRKGLWSQPLIKPIGQEKLIKIDARCKKCGQIHKFYIMFTKDPRLIATARKGGYIRFPESDVILCSCGAKVVLTSLRRTVEAETGKKVAGK